LVDRITSSDQTITILMFKQSQKTVISPSTDVMLNIKSI